MILPKLLDNNGNEIRRLHPVSLSIVEKAVPLSTASMTLVKGEKIPDRSWIELFTANGSAGVFRSKAPIDSYGNTVTNMYTLEHAICEVGDYLVRSDITQTSKTLSSALTQVFNYYGGSKWQLGTVSATGNVILSANYSNLLQTMNSLIAQIPGAMMQFDFTTTPWTINVGMYDSEVSAEGRLSRNMESVSIKKDDSQLCTRLWIGGYKYDADTLSEYGVVEKYLQNKEYTYSQRNRVADSYLGKYKRPQYTISINGVDFSSMTGETLDRVSVGKLYRLVIPDDNVTVSENVISIQWKDVVNSEKAVVITLSKPDTTLVDFITRSRSREYGAGGEYEYQTSKNKEFSAQISANENNIALVVTQRQGLSVINSASIMLAINNDTSITNITSDKIGLDGATYAQSFTTNSEAWGQLLDGQITATEFGGTWGTFENLHALKRFWFRWSPNQYYEMDVTPLTINGVTYNFFTGIPQNQGGQQ